MTDGARRTDTCILLIGKLLPRRRGESQVSARTEQRDAGALRISSARVADAIDRLAVGLEVKPNVFSDDLAGDILDVHAVIAHEGLSDVLGELMQEDDGVAFVRQAGV